MKIKNYTAHPHDMVHVPEKFRENTSMRFQVTVQIGFLKKKCLHPPPPPGNFYNIF